MKLCNNVKKIIFPVSIIVLASLTLITCGGPVHYRIYSSIALPEDQVSLLQETPDSKGGWIILIDEEDVHDMKGSIWSWHGRRSCTYEILPGNHTIVAIYEHSFTNTTGGGRYSTTYYTYSESLNRMEFYAEKGHKYLFGGDVMDKGYWNPWIKDISSNQIVSKIIPPDLSGVNVLGKKCTIDSKYVLSSVIKDNILYIPPHLFYDPFFDGANVKTGSVGKVICETIYKTRESGHWQYRKTYIVDIVDVVGRAVGRKGLILVAREGLMPI